MLVIYWRSGIWKKNQGCFNLSQFMVTGIGANPLKVPYCTLTLSLRVKSIFRAVPHVTAKSIIPKHPRNTRNHHHTGKLSRMNYFIAFQYILGTI